MTMKTPLRILLLLAVLVLPALALAQEGFVPLTNIEAIKYVGNTNSLPDFLNSIYQVAIGLAAVIGVLQLMRAGLTWMTAGGSHEKIGQARGLIRDTLLGLLLVLAPTIVFSLINPSILNLEIGGLNELKLPQRTTTSLNPAQDSSSDPDSPQHSNPTGDIVSNTRIGGDYFFTFSSLSEAQREIYVSSCKVIPSEVSELIRQRVPSVDESKAGDEGIEDHTFAKLYLLYCESYSTPFREYQITEGFWGLKEAQEYKSFPESEARRKQYENGCISNGGKLRDVVVPASGCTADEKKIIDEVIRSGKGDPDDYGSKCRSVGLMCKRP
ncbi:MAG TPA: hypothetical protein VFY28_00685 [Candidatus Paceibacterota bacterium]|nr:hypothetical protein [Candidatus Paceibacterota bacterium]